MAETGLSSGAAKAGKAKQKTAAHRSAHPQDPDDFASLKSVPSPHPKSFRPKSFSRTPKSFSRTKVFSCTKGFPIQRHLDVTAETQRSDSVIGTFEKLAAGFVSVHTTFAAFALTSIRYLGTCDEIARLGGFLAGTLRNERPGKHT
ncbi:hypothetical protein V4R08_05715 [Nitrobacter sp. NHB1]|uniref:hypothetical protein n=1 Tax=Nitrobacter sp. NHB1 TaxID=3119830 RepID=UPI002FFE6AAA